MFIRPDMRRALEEHVLEQVRESGPPGSFIRGADVVPKIHCDNRRGVVLGQCDEEPVIEVEGFYRNSHCRKLPAMQTHWNPLGALT